MYAVVKQESGLTQRLVATKARLAKQGLTIPWLELVSAHMTTNLLVNVREALKGFPVTELYGWLDSTVALHWIKGGGQYKQFVENRRRKIQAQPEITWRHVPTEENPADLASRGGDVEHREMWWHGPEWIAHPKCWPPDPVTQPTTESRAEVKVTKELFAIAMNFTDELDGVLGKLSLSKAMRVCAWVSRFALNSRHTDHRISGPLTTEELKKQHLFWVNRAQQSCDLEQRSPTVEPATKPGRDPLVLRKDTRRVSHLFPGHTPVHSEVCPTRAPADPPRGSWPDHDKCQEVPLGATPTTTSQAVHLSLSWLPEIPGAGCSNSASRKFTCRPYAGYTPIPSDRGGICWPTKLPEMWESQRQGIHSAVCLFPEPRIVPGSDVLPGNSRVSPEPQETHREERTTSKDLLR